MINEEENLSGWQKEILKAVARTGKFEKLFVRGKVRHWLRWHFRPRMTEIPEETGPSK